MRSFVVGLLAVSLLELREGICSKGVSGLSMCLSEVLQEGRKLCSFVTLGLLAVSFLEFREGTCSKCAFGLCMCFCTAFCAQVPLPF